jgi:CubicO group peptidase (beta-lactamase class C family)
MKLKALLLLLFISIYGFSQQVESSYSTKEKLEYFKRVADTLQQKSKTPGMAIAIIYQNELIFKKTYGYRDIKNKLPVTNNTLFEIASLTKAFTGVIASKLEKQGKFNWNDKVIQYVPEFKLEDSYATKNASLKDLFTHNVGLAQHYYLTYGPQLTKSEMLEKIAFLSFDGSFREKFLYNNFMYSVAGIVEERVSNKTWHSLMKEIIFTPLEMNSSYTKLDDFLNSDNMTISYKTDGVNVIPHKPSPDAYAPSGNTTTSTIDDMANWAKMLANSGKFNDQEFLTAKQFKYITSSLNVRYPSSGGFYGIGWEIDTERNVIFHRGSSAGQRPVVAFQPEQGYAVVVLSNQESPVSYLLEFYASKIFLENDFSRSPDLDNTVERIANAPETEAEKFTIEDANILKELNKIEGTYIHPAYGNIEIKKLAEKQFSFKYYGFEGTIKHNKELEFTAFVDHFMGKDKFNFKLLKGTGKISGIEVHFPYSKPLNFVKN